MKTVLITGASRGIGLATAKKFLKEGWFVLGASTSENKNLHHKNYQHYILDLSNSKNIDDCTKLIKKDHKQIEVLINNAGVSFEPDEDKPNLDSLRKNLEVNLFGTISFTENLIDIINPSGHIINISSRMSSLEQLPKGDYPAYRISKTALNMYTKALSFRLKDITVSAFDPGWVKTDMGGMDATREPEIPAEELFNLVNSPHPTGNFWFEGKIRSW
jgi:NAD(P)-dependent dehydrogenase (short-subunit alcohol dehydrogenase family)